MRLQRFTEEWSCPLSREDSTDGAKSSTSGEAAAPTQAEMEAEASAFRSLPHMTTAFNDLSVHVFPRERLESTQAETLWTRPPEEHTTAEGEML